MSGRLALVALLITTACGSAPLAPDGVPWRSVRGHAHPLIGKVWSRQRGQLVSPSVAIEAARGSRYILLGERHDNADHHRLQAFVLRRLVDLGRRPTVLFEMIDRSQRAALATWRQRVPVDLDALADALKWAHSGWPAFALYRPIFEVLTAAGLRLGPANLPRSDVRKIAFRGLSALPESLRVHLGLDRPFPEPLARAMSREVVDGHCGMLPVHAADAMATAQRVRDAFMARSLADAATRTDGAVLIAGNGHTRPDRGVPWHLRRLHPTHRIVSIHFVEVPQALTRTDAEAIAGDSGADFAFFTARVDDVDPCEKYRDALRKLKRSRSP